jgi:adenylate cyclase
MPRRLAAIVFTDLAGYSQLAQSNESGALRLLQEQERLVRPLLTAHEGRKVKSMGDGLLLEFENALGAVEFGAELQRVATERNSREGVVPLRIRIGVHLGDVQRQGRDIVGDAVNVASRIEPLAEPGGLCISEQVYAQVRNKVPYRMESLGLKSLKGIREPVQVYRVQLPWATPKARPSTSNLPRLAVLPLVNIAADPKDEYFTDGLTEELISTLAQLRGLRVISHTSVNQYKGTAKSIAQIGSELGADHVLEGSVRKAGDQLRIAVQLIDARTDEHLWARTYDRKLENVFAIQADVAERAADALKVELLKSEREAIHERPTSSVRAFEYYLRGTQAVRQVAEFSRDQARTDREAERYLEAAIREDPQFSAAYSALATHLIQVSGVTRPAKELFPRARELVAKALELNPNSSDAHTAKGNLAMQADLDWASAEAEFQQAIELNPSNSAAHTWYAYLLHTLQRFPEARKQNLAAVGLDPLWVLPAYQLASGYELTGDTETYLEYEKKMIETFGDGPGPRFGVAWGHALLGHAEEALALIEPMKSDTSQHSRTGRAALLALLGRVEETRELLADWEAGRLSEFTSLCSVAMGYAVVGEKEKALALLEREQREGGRGLWSNYQWFQFDSLRDDPRFVALLREMKLPTTVSRPLWKPPRLRKG